MHLHSIFHGCQINFKEINDSKDTIFCVLEQGLNTGKCIYYKKIIQDKEWILKSLISDNTYDKNIIEGSKVRIYKVSESNKLSYIYNNITIEDEEITNVNELFLKTYKEYE